MLTTIQIKIKKELPFDSDKIENYFEKQGIDVLRWAVTDISENEYIIDASVIK